MLVCHHGVSKARAADNSLSLDSFVRQRNMHFMPCPRSNRFGPTVPAWRCALNLGALTLQDPSSRNNSTRPTRFDPDTTTNMRVVAAPLRQLLWRRSFSVSTFHASNTSSVPRVASVWQSVIPKAFRRPDDPVSVAERQKAQAMKSKEWNPATFFIVIALLIGSNAIQMIALRNERLSFTRKTDAKIALLRETIERVLRGENVDVERVLGTGDPEKEKEWEQVMQELESDNTLWKNKNKNKREAAGKEAPAQQPPADESPKLVSQIPTPEPQTPARRPGFF